MRDATRETANESAPHARERSAGARRNRTGDFLNSTPLPPHPATTADSFSPEDWEFLRESHTQPLHVSEYTGSAQYRAEFVKGAQALGLIRADGSESKLVAQQLVIADACNATDADGYPLNTVMGIIVPRRSSKTTTLLALALGRCLSRDDYLVGFTLATTGAKARDRFLKDIAPALERAYPDEATRPFKIRRSTGSERITFDNGSIFQVLTPSGEAFRSDAFDCILIDEAGEASAALTEDLITGALPTFDTRPHAQLIVAGTAAKFRTGNLLWDTLEDGRKGGTGTGIVEYAAPDYTTVDDLETWEQALPIVRAAHPGIGTLTTEKAIERNYNRLPRKQFMREYLSVFEDVGATTGIIRPEAWKRAELLADVPPPPEHFALAISASPNQASASIVAAWRVDGRAHVVVLEHRDGVAWLAPQAAELARKYDVPIVHDNFGVVLAETEALRHAKPKVRLAPQTTKQVQTAAALFVKEVDTGNLTHYEQAELTAAVHRARKRKIGASGWAFGRADVNDDIAPIEAASMALRYYDENPRKRSRIILAMAPEPSGYALAA